MNNDKTSGRGRGGRGRGGRGPGSSNAGSGRGVSRANNLHSESTATVASNEAAYPTTSIAVEKVEPQSSSASSAARSPKKPPPSPDKEGRPPRPPQNEMKDTKEMVVANTGIAAQSPNRTPTKKKSEAFQRNKQNEAGMRVRSSPLQLIQAALAQSPNKAKGDSGGSRLPESVGHAKFKADEFSWASHPARDSSQFSVAYTAKVLLSLFPEKVWKKVHPSYPGRQLCVKFSRFGGVCDFGMSCKFDHPTKGRSTDETLVDAALASMDKPLHEAYLLAFAIIRTVESYDMCPQPELAGAAVRELFLYSVDKLHATCIQLLSRNWTLAVSSCAYGLEVTLLYSVIPRCAERVRGFIRGLYLEMSIEVDRKFSSIRLALLDRESAVLNTMNKGVPLPPRANGDGDAEPAVEDTAVAAALCLHRSIMTHSNESVGAMHKTAGIRDGVIEELKAILVPAVYEEVENFMIQQFPLYAGSKAQETGNSFDLDIELLPFGSSANTVGTLTSDLDIVLDISLSLRTKIGDGEVITKGNQFNQWQKERFGALSKKYLQYVLDALDLDTADAENSSSPFTLREFVSSARVPVLKLKHTATGIDIDLIEGSTNTMGLLNTQLLRDYASADPRVRPLMLAVKRWASARCVSVSSNGTLSTYCWMLMVVFFLQVTVIEKDSDTAAPALKLRQLCGSDARGNETYKLRHQASLTQIHEEVQQQTRESPNPIPENEDIVRLLVRFFAFYGTEAENSFRTFENIAILRGNSKVRKRGANSAEMDRNWQRARARSASMTDESSPRSRLGSNVTEDIATGTESAGPARQIKGVADAKEEMIDTIVFDMEKNLSIKDEIKALQEANGDAGEDVEVSFTPDETRKKKENVQDSATIWRICIEDPFEPEHDLGSVVRSQIGQSYILTELRRALCLLHDYLISKTIVGEDLFQVLCTVNENPPDLSYPCHICYSMDHKVKECPRFVCYKCGKHGHFTSQCDGDKKKKLVGTQTRENKNNKRKSRKV